MTATILFMIPVWRARFFGHEPQTDLALLEKGFHLVYMDVADLFGSPVAVNHWNAFYNYLTGHHGFNRRAALEGMSRGGPGRPYRLQLGQCQSRESGLHLRRQSRL